MANNYLQFSTSVRLSEAEEKILSRYLSYLDLRADGESKEACIEECEISEEDAAKIEEVCGGEFVLDYSISKQPDPNQMGNQPIYVIALISEEGNSLEPVAALLHLFFKAAKRDDHHFLRWACTCSKMREDEFNGGTCLITAKDIYWMSPDDQLDYLKDVARRAERKDDDVATPR